VVSAGVAAARDAVSAGGFRGEGLFTGTDVVMAAEGDGTAVVSGAIGDGSSMLRDGAAIKSAPTRTAAAAPPAHIIVFDFDDGAGGAAVMAVGIEEEVSAELDLITVDPPLDSIAVMRAFDCSRKLTSARRMSSADW